MNTLEWEKRLRKQAADLRESALIKEKQVNWIKQRDFKYQVRLSSLWDDYGESDITVTAVQGETLKDVEDRADKEFKELNNRSDVQALKAIRLIFPDNTIFIVTHPYKRRDRK